MDARRALALLLCLMLLAVPVALADEEEKNESKDENEDDVREAKDEDDKDDDEDDADEVERRVGIKVHGLQAEIEMKRKDSGVEDKIEYKLDAKHARVKVSYKSENDTTETKTELGVRFREIVEYVDTNGNGAFDPSADRVVTRVDTVKADWAITGPVDETRDNVTGKRFEARGAFPEGGSLGLVFHVYGTAAMFNGTDLRPGDIKIDILLDDWNYTANDSALAIRADIERKTETEVEHDDDVDGSGSEGVHAFDGDFGAYFTWAPTANVDGTDRAVGTTIVKESNETSDEGTKIKQVVYLSYARGTHIDHDPVMGIQTAMVANAAGVPGPGLLAAVAGVGLAAVLLRRRK